MSAPLVCLAHPVVGWFRDFLFGVRFSRRRLIGICHFYSRYFDCQVSKNQSLILDRGMVNILQAALA
jgi:hypothetical protein